MRLACGRGVGLAATCILTRWVWSLTLILPRFKSFVVFLFVLPETWGPSGRMLRILG